jgi:hypothetical protein
MIATMPKANMQAATKDQKAIAISLGVSFNTQARSEFQH